MLPNLSPNGSGRARLGLVGLGLVAGVTAFGQPLPAHSNPQQSRTAMSETGVGLGFVARGQRG
jgi:hypothetical protein